MEIIVVIAVLSILSAIAVPKFSDNSAAETRTAAEVVVADIRQAQARAITQNNSHNVAFNLNGSGYTIVDDSGTVKSVTLGVGDYSGFEDVTLTGVSFAFDRTGAPTVGQTITVTSGANSLGVVVRPQTGRAGIS